MEFVKYFGQDSEGHMHELKVKDEKAVEPVEKLDYDPATHFSKGVPKNPWADVPAPGEAAPLHEYDNRGAGSQKDLKKNPEGFFGFGLIRTFDDWLKYKNVTKEQDPQLAWDCKRFYTFNTNF